MSKEGKSVLFIILKCIFKQPKALKKHGMRKQIIKQMSPSVDAIHSLRETDYVKGRSNQKNKISAKAIASNEEANYETGEPKHGWIWQ